MREAYQGRHDYNYEQGSSPVPLNAYGQKPIHGFYRVLETDVAIRSKEMHRRLKNDLTEHICEKFGRNQPGH
jgi:hypothetical protein